jgi:SPP1 gp7 family putative phage head morphogenesis protein
LSASPPAPRHTADAKPKRANFFAARRAEIQYGRRLRGVAKQIGDLITGFAREKDLFEHELELGQLLQKYSDMLIPWAKSIATTMLADVSNRDVAAWSALSKEMSRDLHKEIASAPTGELMRALLNEQVTLITSLPIDAAQRVHRLTLKGIEGGTRASEIAKEIMRSGQVSRGQATRIARTEVARTATALVQARATYAGSTHFKWVSVGDSDVRPLHRKLNGHVFRWDDPPVADEHTGIKALPGSIWNCRCWPSPILGEEL